MKKSEICQKLRCRFAEIKTQASPRMDRHRHLLISQGFWQKQRLPQCEARSLHHKNWNGTITKPDTKITVFCTNKPLWERKITQSRKKNVKLHKCSNPLKSKKQNSALLRRKTTDASEWRPSLTAGSLMNEKLLHSTHPPSLNHPPTARPQQGHQTELNWADKLKDLGKS